MSEGIEKKEIPSAFDLSNDDLSTPDLDEGIVKKDTEKSDTEGKDGKEEKVSEIRRKGFKDDYEEEEEDEKVDRKPAGGEEEEEEEEDDSVEVYDVQEEVEVDSEGKSAYYHLAQGWIEDGFLPENAEIKEDISSQELDDLLRKSKEEPYKEELKQEFFSELRDEGYTEENLELAKQIGAGVPREQIEDAQVYTQIGKEDFTGEERKDERREVLMLFYKEKGFSDEKSERYADRAFYDETDEEELKDAQDYFLNKGTTLKQKNEQAAKQEIENRKRKKAEKISFIKEKLQDKDAEINGVKIPKELKEKAFDAFFKKTESIKNSEGKTIPVTPYQKKMYERNDNRELELMHMINIALDLNIDSFKEYSTSRATSKIIEETAGRTRKKVKNPDRLRKLVNKGKYKGGKINIERRSLT